MEDALGRVNGILLTVSWKTCMSVVVWLLLTDHCPGYQAAEAARGDYSKFVAIRAVARKGCAELFTALVYHKVDGRPQRVSHLMVVLATFQLGLLFRPEETWGKK